MLSGKRALVLAGFLVACGQTARNRPAAGMQPDHRSAAGEAGAASAAPTPSAAGGGPQLIDVTGAGGETDSMPDDSCSCAGDDFAATVTVASAAPQKLAFNLVEWSSCAPGDPAHVRATAACHGISLAWLGLAAEASGGAPLLTIDHDQLRYTDNQGTTWIGVAPSGLDVQPHESVLEGTLELDVTSSNGETRHLLLAFRLCAEWSAAIVIC